MSSVVIYYFYIIFYIIDRTFLGLRRYFCWD